MYQNNIVMERKQWYIHEKKRASVQLHFPIYYLLTKQNKKTQTSIILIILRLKKAKIWVTPSSFRFPSPEAIPSLQVRLAPNLVRLSYEPPGQKPGQRVRPIWNSKTMVLTSPLAEFVRRRLKGAFSSRWISNGNRQTIVVKQFDPSIPPAGDYNQSP